MDVVGEITKWIGTFFINGIFAAVFVIVFFHIFFKKRIDTSRATTILKWLLLSYSFLTLFHFLVMLPLLNTETHSVFLNRATGPHWWAYWMMFTMNVILPLLLLFKKPGSNLYFILLVSVLMNIGWLFESFVIHMTSLERDYTIGGAEYNPYLPFYVELIILFRGLFIGMAVLLIGNGLRFYEKYRSVKG